MLADVQNSKNVVILKSNRQIDYFLKSVLTRAGMKDWLIMKYLSKENIKQPLKYLCFMLLIIVVSAILTYLIHPDIQSTINSVSSNVPKSVEHKTGFDLVVAYIINNGLKVPLQMLILGLIPVPFLYWLQPVFTAILP